jgi:hypothetical protein
VLASLSVALLFRPGVRNDWTSPRHLLQHLCPPAIYVKLG